MFRRICLYVFLSVLITATVFSLAPDTKAQDDGDVTGSAITMYLTYTRGELSPGTGNSPLSHTIDSTTSDKYWRTGIMLDHDATLVKIQMWGKFDYSYSANSERAAVTINQARTTGWDVLNTFRSKYSSSFVWQSKNVNISMLASRSYMLELLVPGIGDSKYQILAVRLCFDEGG